MAVDMRAAHGVCGQGKKSRPAVWRVALGTVVLLESSSVGHVEGLVLGNF